MKARVKAQTPIRAMQNPTKRQSTDLWKSSSRKQAISEPRWRISRNRGSPGIACGANRAENRAQMIRKSMLKQKKTVPKLRDRSFERLVTQTTNWLAVFATPSNRQHWRFCRDRGTEARNESSLRRQGRCRSGRCNRRDTAGAGSSWHQDHPRTRQH